MNIKKKIIKNIIKAQYSSNAGKFIYDKDVPRACREAVHERYDVKAQYIFNAIRLITTNPPCGINFYCEKTPDQNGYQSVIVYFETKVNGERLQVSFHTPYSKADLLYPYIGKGRKTRWNKQIGGSMKACMILKDAYNIA